MATQGDVRRIALSLPGTREDPDEFRFLVEGKMFVWLWPERVAPKRARVPNPDVIVVRVGNDIDKQVFIELDLLTDVVTEAWRCRASKRLRSERDG